MASKDLVKLMIVAMSWALATQGCSGCSEESSSVPPAVSPGCSEERPCEGGQACVDGKCVPNQAPVADAGADLSVHVGDRVTLDGTASADPEGQELTFAWVQTEGDEVELDQADGPSPGFTAPSRSGTLVFELTVTDPWGASSSATVRVEVLNDPPVADTGEALEVEPGSQVTLDGTGSMDPEGLALTFTWTQVLGEPVVLDSAQSPTPTFTAPPVKGELAFELVVSDGEHESAPATSTVVVLNSPPVARAGEDQEVDGASVVTLDATGSSDPDGDELTFDWEQVDGPPVTLDDPASATPVFAAPRGRCTMVFRVTVDDGEAQASDEVTVAVRNNPPVAVVGPPVEAPAETTLRLDGSGSFDADGDELTFAWTQVDGPDVALDDPGSPTPRLTTPAERCTLRFELVVNDGRADSEPAQAIITVANRRPVADAGRDIAVDRGEEVTLDGSGSLDPDGDEIRFHWSRLSGPPVELSDPEGPSPTFTAPDERAVLEFGLVVSDDVSDSDMDLVRVFVDDRPPVADAGPNLIVGRGEEVTLDGSGSSDPDGDDLTFEWIQLGGPPVLLDGPDGPTPSFVAPMERTRLEFGLRVSDGFSWSGQDSMVVHVDNEPPVADAGEDQVARAGDAVTLDGSGSADPDGDPITYQWTQVQGPEVVLSDPTSPTPTFTAPPGRAAFVFQLVVHDGITPSDEPDLVMVNVDNALPEVVLAQEEILAGLGEEVTLDASGSSDPDGDELSFHWEQVAGEPVVLEGRDQAVATFTTPMIRGELTFHVTVSDGLATVGPAQVVVHVGNTPPVAAAGRDRRVDRGAEVTLDGTGSSDADGDELSFTWSQVEGPEVALSDPSSPTPSFTAPDERANLVFELVVNDGFVDSEPDRVQVFVGNSPPVADAGRDRLDVAHASVVTLDGTGSSDVDGDELSYSWRQVQGPEVILSDPEAPRPTFLAPEVKRTMVFELVVNDGLVDSEPDTVTIRTVNTPPVADAGPSATVEGGAEVTLDGTGSSDADGDELSFMWNQVEGNPVALDDPASPTPTFTAPMPRQVLVFELEVSDGEDTDTARVEVEVRNHPPVADAGEDLVAQDGGEVALDGSGSSDVDGDDLTYRWEQIQGPEVEITNGDQAVATVDLPVARAEYLFRLTVTDEVGAQSSDEVEVTVPNHAPMADAGADMVVGGGSRVTLDGTGSADLDGDDLTFLWRQLEGPGVVLSDPAARAPEFTAPIPKSTLVFELVVTDPMGLASEPDTVVVTVENHAPVADAGDDLHVEGGSRVILDASGSSDIDGDDLTFRWEQIDGEEVLLADADTPSPSFDAPVPRQILTFRVTVSDGEAEASDTVSVFIDNHVPVADAGPDQEAESLTLVTLDGTGSSDLDGDDLTYHWEQVEGEAVGLDDPESATPSFTTLEGRGTYRFQLTVSDGLATSEPDEVVVTVGNHAPSADAGEDRLGVEGGSVVTLDGSGSSDSDGDRLEYRWRQVEGPAVLLDDPASVAPSFTAPLERATLVFELVVDDGYQTSEPDRVTVTTRNNPPVADAGENQEVAAGSQVVLDGTGSSDLDGDDLTCSWRQVEGPDVVLSGQDTCNPSFFAPDRRTALVFELVVNDGFEDSEPDTVTVSIANNQPVADAGDDQQVDPGQVVTLDGSGSSDPDGDALAYAWTRIAGPEVELSGSDTASPSFVAPATKSQLVFSLVVNDGFVDSDPDLVTIDVANNPPVADAGDDLEVDGGSVVVLDGAGSSDPDGDALSYTWTQIAGTMVNIQGGDTATPSFTAPVPKQTLTFRLVVNDGTVDSDPDIVDVVIRNHVPVAEAGPDQEVVGGRMVQLDGSGSSDLDGDGLTYEWTQLRGEPVILSSQSATPTFTAPVPRQDLVFQLRVHDGEVWSAADTVTIHIGNNPPTADAGEGQLVRGGSLVTLDGTGSSDPDGDDLTYRWEQVEGDEVVLSDADSPRPSFAAPVPRQVLTFRLQVCDPFDACSGWDEVSVSILNNPPVADAGQDQVVRRWDEVTLDASDSRDVDGDPLTCEWRQLSGTSVELSKDSDDGCIVGFVAPLQSGDLNFEVTVRDGHGGLDTDTVTVSVRRW